jgi:hypothetical protein
MTKRSKSAFSATISRRTQLTGICVGALAYRGAPPARPAQALPSAFTRFMVGEFELTVIQDRVGDFTPEIFELGAPKGAVAAELARFNSARI